MKRVLSARVLSLSNTIDHIMNYVDDVELAKSIAKLESSQFVDLYSGKLHGCEYGYLKALVNNEQLNDDDVTLLLDWLIKEEQDENTLDGISCHLGYDEFGYTIMIDDYPSGFFRTGVEAQRVFNKVWKRNIEWNYDIKSAKKDEDYGEIFFKDGTKSTIRIAIMYSLDDYEIN